MIVFNHLREELQHKRVLLLAVSCKTGGLCPGGLDLDNPKQWIRIVRDDGQAGAVQGFDIDFAEPLDVIEFDGRPMPQGKQKENWVIDNHSCENKGRIQIGNGTIFEIIDWAYNNYAYHGFWNNYKSFLNGVEFENVTVPSESIIKATNVRIYEDDNSRAKIDFDWSGAKYRIKWVSMTDQDFYGQIHNGGEVEFDNAYLVVSIPKETGYYVNEQRAYKFVSKIFEI